MEDDEVIVLDVREKEEVELGKIPGSINIPLNSLRENLDKLNKEKKIYVYCAVGQRAYLGCRILMQKGFSRVYNISGGYKTWEDVSLKQSNIEGPEYRIGKDDYIYQFGAHGDQQDEEEGVNINIDASGLQCPGPIMKLNKEIKNIPPKSTIQITATDPGFLKDVKSWCNVTSNKLLDIKDEGNKFIASIQKTEKTLAPSAGSTPPLLNDKTMVVFSDSMDKALASFVIANGALSMGRKVTMFFTFWGLNILKKRRPPKTGKDVISRIFGWMLPKGPAKLTLSKLNFFGLGSRLMKKVMKKKKVNSLEELMEQALESGVQIIACQMSMDIMGIKKEELIDGITVGGVASYIEAGESANMNLFI
jgi:peroxiredoxin family protein/rhodanese-related sulfurtransferase/TusA-related sulfurtransferase